LFYFQRPCCISENSFLFYFLEGFAIYFLYGMKKSKATYRNNLVKELQPANSQLNEEPQSLTVDKVRIELSETHESTDETDYKHPTQSILAELDSPLIISGLNSGMILRHDVKQNLGSEMDSDVLRKSLAYINDLEKILDCKAEEYYNKNTTTTTNSVDYVIGHEIKNSANTHNAPLPSTDRSSVVSDAALSVVPELSASLMSSPANVSLPSDHIQTTGNIKNHMKRSPSSSSARNLYPNVVIVSYDSDDEDIEQDKEGVSGKSKYGDETETEEIRTASSQTFFQRDSVLENQEYFPADKQNANVEDSRLDAELRKQSPSPPPFSPPPPPPPPPPPLPPPFTAFPPSSPKIVLKSSNTVGEMASFEGGSDASPARGDSNRRDDVNSKKEVTTPITPDPTLLLTMRSFKTSDFASKLEAMLQEKLHDVKPDTSHENPQLLAKHSTNTENDANMGRLKRHPPVVNADTNEQWNGMAESNSIQSKADGQLTDREMELADIRGKLEQFLANRADASALPRPLNHPNIVSLTNESNEMKREIDGAELKPKQFPKKPLLNGTKELKLNHENNNIDVVRKQMLLMGEVLASIKFIGSKNRANSESSLSDASEEDEVFEDLTSHTEVSVKEGK
jgi:hypothetical protein